MNDTQHYYLYVNIACALTGKVRSMLTEDDLKKAKSISSLVTYGCSVEKLTNLLWVNWSIALPTYLVHDIWWVAKQHALTWTGK